MKVISGLYKILKFFLGIALIFLFVAGIIALLTREEQPQD